MSQLVFPSLPGMKIEVDREPYFATQVQETISGRELRSTWWTYPRYKYRLAFEILNATKGDFQTLFGYLAKHFGALDSFLWTDPQDNAVTDHGFGLGDGITTAYQLQRTLAGSVTDASGATYTQATKPYTNLLFNSSFETDANGDGAADGWIQYNNSAVEPVITTIVPGMNGGKAQRVAWGIPATSQKGIALTNVSAPPGPAFVAGQWYTISIFARASAGNAGKYIGLGWNAPLPNFLTVISCPPLAATWQRYVFQVFWVAGTVPNRQVYFSISNVASGSFSQPQTFGTLDFDLAQITPGQWGATDLQPIETPAAATATKNPQLWPAVVDGFEPIFDLNGDPTIYQDGDWPGRRQLYSYRRENILPFSEQFDNAAWTHTNITVTPNTTAAPNGATTADTISEGAAATVIHQMFENTSPAEAQGELRCYSVWLKAGNLPNVMWRAISSDIGVNFNLSTGVIDSLRGAPLASGVITSPNWPGWFRVWFTERVGASLGNGATLQPASDGTYANAAYTGTSRTFFAWGAMVERTSNILGPTPYIPTPSSAAVTAPADYSVGSTGIVTLTVAPAAGTWLTWDGSYYRRVRFAQDNLSASRLASAMWAAKAVELVSVK